MVLAELLAKFGIEVEEKPFDEVNEKLEGIKSRLEFLGAAEVLRAIFEISEHFSSFAEHLGVAATSAGLTVEALQRLNFAAGQAGVTGDEVSQAMAHLTRTLYEARQGSTEAKKAFENAGIPEAQIGTFRTSADALGAFSDSLKNTQDPIKRQAMTMALFGRGSYNMVEFLAQGKQSIKEVGEAADKMGAVVSGKDIEALRVVEDTLAQLWLVVKAFSASVAAMFAPSVRDAARSMMAFYAANRAVLMTSIAQWVKTAVGALGYLFGIMEGVTAKFLRFAAAHPLLVRRIGEVVAALSALSLVGFGVGKLLDGLKGLFGALGGGVTSVTAPLGLAYKLLGGMKTIIGNLIARLGVLVVTTFPAVGEALFAFGTWLTATPVGWLIAGIAALVLGLQAAYVMLFKHGDFKDTWLGKMYEGAKGLGKGALKFFGLMDDDADNKPAAAQAPPTDDAKALSSMLKSKGIDANAFMNNLDSIGTARGALPFKMPDIAAATAAADGPTMSAYNMNAPITINVADAGSASNLGNKVKEGIKEHMDKVYRESQRSLRPVQAH